MNITTNTQATSYYQIVSAHTQGKRATMEDFINVMTPFSSPMSMMASIYDGHAGALCSHYLVQHLPGELQRKTQLTNRDLPSSQIIEEVFQELDNAWLKSVQQNHLEDGSTALCVVVDGADLMVANCGDSRALLYQGGQTLVLNRDHVPEDNTEKQRILKLGGVVIGGRLQGKLGVSRAFGNYDFKESKLLISEPEVTEVNLQNNLEFLVLASDGLFEQFSNEEVCSYIKNSINSKPLEEIAQELIEEAIDRGSEDNISIIVVKFGKAYQKLLKKRSKNLTKSSEKISVTKSLSRKTSADKSKLIPNPMSLSDKPAKEKKEKLQSMLTKSISSNSCPGDPASLFSILQLDRKLEKKIINKLPKPDSPIKSRDYYRLNEIPEDKSPKTHWRLKSIGRALNKSS